MTVQELIEALQSLEDDAAYVETSAGTLVSKVYVDEDTGAVVIE